MAGVGLTGACARQGAPPGGPEDRRPPVVVATRPDTFEVVERDLNTVRFVFDERISERVAGGSLREAVLVSPRTGEVDVDHNRGALEVSLAGGFQPGRVYRVTLLPVVSDLFGNQMRDPFELVFSTGAELVPSAVAGVAWDRVTGQGIDGLRVRAMDTRDSTVYLARTDTGGVYAFRYLPPGPYHIVAYQDQNRNDRVDPSEAQGSRLLQLTGPDTIVTEIGVLQADTTPATLTAAETVDSVTLALRFDDYLNPAAPVGTGNVGLTAVALDDSAGIVRNDEGEPQPAPDQTAPEVERVFHAHEYSAWVRAVTDSVARLDSLQRAEAQRSRQAGDTARADSLVALLPRPVPAPLPGASRPGRTGGASRGQGADPDPGPPRGLDGRPLPSQRLVVRLASPLIPNRPYQAVATGIENLAGVPLGRGEAVVALQPPPAPAADSLAADSLAADSLAADSLAADSTGAVPDSAGPRPPPPPDSTGTEPRPDTVTAPPDTLGTPRRGRSAPSLLPEPGALRRP